MDRVHRYGPLFVLVFAGGVVVQAYQPEGDLRSAPVLLQSFARHPDALRRAQAQVLMDVGNDSGGEGSPADALEIGSHTASSSAYSIFKWRASLCSSLRGSRPPRIPSPTPFFTAL